MWDVLRLLGELLGCYVCPCRTGRFEGERENDSMFFDDAVFGGDYEDEEDDLGLYGVVGGDYCGD